MIKLGINPIAAHLFIVYYAILATITPPVCPTVFVGSSIAKSNWLKTAFISVKLAPLLYILPFLFIYDNSFILIGSLKDILLNIAEDEKKHRFLLKNTVEFLSRPKTWIENAEFNHLDEY